MSVSVIVSQYAGDQITGRVFGDRFDKSYASLEAALAFGNTKRADGMSVVVRPDYNEEDSEGRFFREWRSFNGEPFKEVRWGQKKSKEAISLGDKVRIKRGICGEGYTFSVSATGMSGHNERILYGHNYGPVREEECELVAKMKCDR